GVSSECVSVLPHPVRLSLFPLVTQPPTMRDGGGFGFPGMARQSDLFQDKGNTRFCGSPIKRGSL
ncbi:MAG: hypothetical protein KDD68_13240, partial [Bdellovibrionales bacterium]|nr:hypothetical protein [Bdellovibrionales bacterium]